MLKSYVAELMLVYDALFEDAKYTFPALESDLVKDQVTLYKQVESRGISVFVTELPRLGKHFDEALSLGTYFQSHLPLSRAGRDSVLPLFMRSLHLRVFDELGNLKEDPDVESIIFLRQFYYCAKKAKIQCSDEKVTAAVQNFLTVDESLPTPSAFWRLDHPSLDDLSRTTRGFKAQLVEEKESQPEWYQLASLLNEYDARLDIETLAFNLDVVSGRIASALGPYKPDEWSFKHGPGAVSDKKKFENRYLFDTWPERLERVFPLARYGYHSYSAWADDCRTCDGSRASWCYQDARGRCLPGARAPGGTADLWSALYAVPKDFEKPRLIASEPSSHMWCQQNIWHYMRTRVQGSWLGKFIKFNDQSRNQQLCLEGSYTGALATVDLSEASDRVSCLAVGNLFRGHFGLLQALQATRTRCVNLNGVGGHNGLHYLNKFSTMGNACTFPVESLLFLSVAIASCLTAYRQQPSMKNIKKLVGKIAVFGDDLIVPSNCRICVGVGLSLIGAKINNRKSFWNGNFRESCGVDAYAGINVTPAYWRAPYSRTPDSYSSTLDVANNFYKKFLVNTSRYLGSTVTGFGKVPVTIMESGVTGLKSFVDPGPPAAKRRWNRKLQRDEVFLPMLITKAVKTEICDDSALLQFFTEDPDPSIAWQSGVVQRPTLKVRRRWVPLADVCRVG